MSLVTILVCCMLMLLMENMVMNMMRWVQRLLAQFSTYYKYFWRWIPEESILQMSHGLYCEADESCVSDDTTVWLYAHDTGEGFNSSLYYCIFYRLEYPNTYMTLEFRSLYESDLPGVMMEWVTRRYEDIAGPSYLIDPTGLPRLVTDTTGAAFVPVNSTYVYDYREGGNAVAVTVLELDEDTQRVKVRVRHMNKSANDVDEFENELQNLASISCGDTVNFTEAVGRTLFHLETPNPSKVSLNVTCGGYLDAYIFGGKPFHLFSDSQGEFNLATFNSTSLYDWNRAFDVSGVEHCSADACNVALTVSPFLRYAGEMIFYAVPGVSSGPAGTVYVNDQYEVYLKSVYMGYYGIYYYCWVFYTSLACGSFYGLIGSNTLIYLSELTEDDIAFTNPITTSSSRSWTSACSSESRAADLQNAYAYLTRYFTENFEVRTFANDSTYLLIMGGIDGATAEVVCDVIYCGSNMFMNESSGLCEPCGQGMMSEPNSTSCVVDCPYLMLESPYVSSTGVMKTTGKYVDLKNSWELYSNGGRDTSYLLYFLNTQGWVLGTGSVASAAYSYEVSASNYRHPVLGESGVESGYSLTCMCADFPYCGECDGLGDGAMVSPLDGTSCFVPYEFIYVTSSENHSIAGNYSFSTMTDGYPVFSSANYTLTRDYSGEWSFVALVNSSIVATKSESISVFWPTNISSTTAWSTGYLSIAPQENSLVMQDIYSSTFFAVTPAPTSSPTMPTPLPTSSPTVSPTAPTPAPTMRPTLGNPSSAPTISDDTSLSYLKELFEQIGSNHMYLGLTVGALFLLCFMVLYRFVYYNRSHQIATQYNFANQIDDFS